MKSTCNIREPEKAEIEDEDVEILEDVGKEPAEKSEEALKKILHDLEFRLRTAIKGQILADFVAEFTPESIEHQAPLSQDERCPYKQGEAQPKAKEQENEKLRPCNIYIGDSFRLFINGSSNWQGAGAGVVLISPDGEILEQSIRLGFKASNNEAKYEALITGLKLAVAAEVDEESLQPEIRECRYTQRKSSGWQPCFATTDFFKSAEMITTTPTRWPTWQAQCKMKKQER
ncbi:hypothetical protein CsSME_00010126 [Camellia sinensis var. sinensis]